MYGHFQVLTGLILLMKERVRTHKDAAQQQPQDDSSYPFNFNIRSLSKIAIPPAAPQLIPSDAPVKAAPRANLKQLYQFLKNQVIVIRQKDRFITNKDSPAHPISSLTKSICLSSHQDTPNVRTICLPKIEHQKNFLSPGRTEQPENSRQNSKCKKILRHDVPKKRLKTVCTNHTSLQQSPLISSISRHISRQSQGNSAQCKDATTMSPPHNQVVDFYLYRQSPHLNKISLNLAVELARTSKRQSTHQQ